MTTIITTATNNALVARHIASISRTTGSALMGASKALLIEEAKRQMRTTSGCHFIYKKANGEVREAFGTLNAAICGKHINGRGDSPETWGCTCYWDMEKGGFRSFLLPVAPTISSHYGNGTVHPRNPSLPVDDCLLLGLPQRKSH